VPRNREVKVTRCQRAPRLPASPPITGGFAFGHSAETCFHIVSIQHAALKGLKSF